MSEIDINVLDSKEKAAIVCLYFARLKSDDTNYKNKCIPSLRIIASKYGQKFNTVKQNKDRYDGVFDNGRSGYHQKPLEKQHKFLYDIYLKYKDLPIDEHEALTNMILAEAASEGTPFFSIKTKDPKTVKAIQSKNNNIEFDGLNILKDSLKIGQPVFIVFGGDNPPWETGLVGMGTISELPYDVGYSGKNYKIKVDIELLLDRPIKRRDLVPFKDAYDIIGIGPITKWEPNQAISQIPEKNAIALMRAMLELSPGIEKELESIVNSSIFERIKGATIKFIPVEVDFGEEISNETDSEYIEVSSDEFSEIYNPDFGEILNGFYMDPRPLDVMKNFINSGKHIIFNGPPGTGKTTIAERACEQAVKCNYVSGYILTTAIADWTSFDTIGGYMPDKSGQLIFQEGVFLKSIRENKWLIIDEINRAEVDKAFGHFFTVLSGKDVELPYKVKSGLDDETIKIKCTSGCKSYYDESEAAYYIGRNWRILATMNTYDKNSLFMLSYAFMRRFSFVYIPVPSEDVYTDLLSERLPDNPEIAEVLLAVIKYSPRKLGAAIILDIVEYLRNSKFTNLIDGLCSLVVTQFEGLSISQIKQLYKDYSCLFEQHDKDILKNYLCEFFDISENQLYKNKTVEAEIDNEFEAEEQEGSY